MTGLSRPAPSASASVPAKHSPAPSGGDASPGWWPVVVVVIVVLFAMAIWKTMGGRSGRWRSF